MTTKHNGIYIEINAENTERVQKLLFKHGIFWEDGKKIQKDLQNLSIYKTDLIHKNGTIYDRKDIIYRSADGVCCTLKVTGDDLDQILDWINSDFKEGVVVKAGQVYRHCLYGGDFVIIESFADEKVFCWMDKDYRFYTNTVTKADILRLLNNKQIELITAYHK